MQFLYKGGRLLQVNFELKYGDFGTSTMEIRISSDSWNRFYLALMKQVLSGSDFLLHFDYLNKQANNLLNSAVYQYNLLLSIKIQLGAWVPHTLIILLS